MRINYYPETDSLYIDLSYHTSKDSIEISEGVVVDYDKNGQIVGIDIDNASSKLNLNELVLNKLPLQSKTISVKIWPKDSFGGMKSSMISKN